MLPPNKKFGEEDIRIALGDAMLQTLKQVKQDNIKLDRMILSKQLLRMIDNFLKNLGG